MTRPQHPSVARVAQVARALGDVADRVVFIGGAIAPVLQTRSPLPRVRATADVDAITASTDYAAFVAIEEAVQRQGFVRAVADARHAHRWRAPDDTPFDLVPAGSYLGGTGSSLELAVIGAAVEAEIEPRLSIRHASAPGLLALKWAAFRDRGAEDPFMSHDLEDILALVVSREELVVEVLASPPLIRDAIRHGFHWFRKSDDRDDLVAANLGHAPQPVQVAALLHDRVRALLSDPS